MPKKTEWNRGDVAEGILGAALVAKFKNRPKGIEAVDIEKASDAKLVKRVKKDWPKVTRNDIDSVLKTFFNGGFNKSVNDIAKKGNRCLKTALFLP